MLSKNSAVPSSVTLDSYRLKAYEVWSGNDSASHHLTVPGFEVFVYCIPHQGNSSGGDLRFISACAMGQIVRFTLADIAGHGQTASDWALRLRGLMRKNINTPNTAKFAQALNAEFSRLSKAGGFATAVITTYFAPTDHLIVCNAGHPRPILYHAAERRWEIFDESASCVLPADRAQETGIRSLPLGILARTDYPMFATPLAPDDIVITYTDALIEAADPSGAQIGEEGLLKIVSSLDVFEPSRLGPAVLDAVSHHRAGLPCSDDLTLCVLQHTATNSPDGPIARLKALGRLVGLVE
jgi:phosphoserine phosphatase RsbU/P